MVILVRDPIKTKLNRIGGDEEERRIGGDGEERKIGEKRLGANSFADDGRRTLRSIEQPEYRRLVRRKTAIRDSDVGWCCLRT